MKKYYYLYYIGMVFTLSGAIIKFFPLMGRGNSTLLGYSFFAAGLTLGLFAVIKYWGWLIKELIKG